LRCLISDLDFFSDNLDSLLLGLLLLFVFFLDLDDVGLELGLLLLPNLLFLGSLLLSGGNLIDNDLGAPLARDGSTLLSIKFSLNSLQSLNLHHQIESLLFFDPVLFEHLIFCELALSDGQYFWGKDHLIHVLHIVISLIHLLLSLHKQCVLPKGRVSFDFEGRIGLFFPIPFLHSLLASHCDRHLLHLLLTHELFFLGHLALIFDDHWFFDGVELCLVDDGDPGIVLGPCANLLTDLLQFVRCDHWCVRTGWQILLICI
jgi:hypothetical protein